MLVGSRLRWLCLRPEGQGRVPQPEPGSGSRDGFCRWLSPQDAPSQSPKVIYFGILKESCLTVRHAQFGGADEGPNQDLAHADQPSGAVAAGLFGRLNPGPALARFINVAPQFRVNVNAGGVQACVAQVPRHDFNGYAVSQRVGS